MFEWIKKEDLLLECYEWMKHCAAQAKNKQE
jgi:hypothetical protein